MFEMFRRLFYNYKQKKLDNEYSENGLSSDLLDKQVNLNIKRNKYNIHDSSEVVSVDDSGNEFVQ